MSDLQLYKSIFEIEDKPFEKRIFNFVKNHNLNLIISPSPMFLIKREDFLDLNGKSKTLRMGNFYKNVRKKLNILEIFLTKKNKYIKKHIFRW
mgnify:CR=1 FL=1